jgi:hypothetical protein
MGFEPQAHHTTVGLGSVHFSSEHARRSTAWQLSVQDHHVYEAARSAQAF